jgi:hypothetical protein
MSQQTIKQQARRSVRDIAQRRRRERLEREQRLEDLAVQVVAAIGERDAAVADTELRAGRALREMVDAEGLSVAEAVEWCDEQVSVREATRLRRLVDAGRDAADESEGAGADTTIG